MGDFEKLKGGWNCAPSNCTKRHLTLLIRDIVPAIVRTVLPIMAIAMGDGIMVMVMCMAVSSAGTKATEACNGVIHVGL